MQNITSDSDALHAGTRLCFAVYSRRTHRAQCGETHVNESEQVARAKEGDQGAWVALVRQHQVALFRLAYLLLQDADDAADVTQESFIRAYRGLHRFDSV